MPKNSDPKHGEEFISISTLKTAGGAAFITYPGTIVLCDVFKVPYYEIAGLIIAFIVSFVKLGTDAWNRKRSSVEIPANEKKPGWLLAFPGISNGLLTDTGGAIGRVNH